MYGVYIKRGGDPLQVRVGALRDCIREADSLPLPAYVVRMDRDGFPLMDRVAYRNKVMLYVMREASHE